ncbi:anthrone oxygenase family protein [uncultured Desulfobacter sp.]|uniref:anthrone oxygenase family protein n=1 Tax=uncultured Desulfobacter sp. TaxID=240139 RepID=UPI0029F4B395|nr:anthrone oxygenase family protein [uncultured Desulfobacter sp.]
MGIFPITIILAAFLCSIVAGFLFAFAIVTMPGIKCLNDSEFIRTFQVMDRVIQNNQPIFIWVWVGATVALLAATVLGLGQLNWDGKLLLAFAALIFLLGVQLPTLIVNVPLNNRLQALDVDRLDASALKAARESFEPDWNRWNMIQMAFASVASALLMVLLFRL